MFLLTLVGLIVVYVLALDRISGTGQASPDPAATAIVAPLSPLVGHWVAEDWSVGSNDWVDRVNGYRASVAADSNSPTKIAGAISTTTASSGLVFDGVDDYLVVPVEQNPLQQARRMTVVTLFEATAAASGVDNERWWNMPGPLNGDSPGSGNDWGLTYDAAGNAQAFFGSPIELSPVVNIVHGEPHTMIMTWESKAVDGDGIARLYVDGVIAGEVETLGEGAGINNQNGLVIGTDAESVFVCCLGSSTNRFFSGAIGEIRLYDRVEDPQQLHAEVFGGAAVTNPTVTVDDGVVSVTGLAFSADPVATTWFRYGTDPTLETATTTVDADTVDNGDGGAEAGAQLRDLKLGTRYFYRLEFRNGGGAFVGRTFSFLLGGEFRVEHPMGAVLLNATDTIDFLAAVGTTTAPKMFTVTNTGDLDMDAVAVTVDGAAANDFEVSPLTTTTVAPGGNTTFSVAFTPPVKGERTVMLKIESSTAETFEVMLVGEGATVWGGPVITFSNTCALCSTDQITSSVAMTRGESSGIFNAAAETQSAGKEGLSPIDTEWAYGTTAELGELDFQPWFAWLGFESPSRAVNQDAVLHLISDDVYIDIRFTSWEDGQGTGGFSYTRTTPGQ